VASEPERPERTRTDAFIFTSLGIRAGFMRHCLHFLRFLSMHACDVVIHGFPPPLPALEGVASITVPRGTTRLFFHATRTILSCRGLVVLTTQENYAQVFLALLAFAVGRPVIYDMQDPVPESFVALFGRRFSKPLVALVSWWLLLSEAVICRVASIVCVVSPGMRTMLAARHNLRDKLFLFPNAHTIHAASSARFAQPTIAFAGGLQPLFRGLEIQVDALALPAARKFRLLIAGEGERAWLERRIAQTGVGDRVSVLGFLSPAEVQQLWEQAHLLVVENLSYGLPSKLFEAVSAGVVVVSPAASADVNAVLGDGALTFDGSASGLAEALDSAWAQLDQLRVKQCRNTKAFLQAIEREQQALGTRVEDLARRARPIRKMQANGNAG